MFASIDDVIQRFADAPVHRQPHASATVVYLADPAARSRSSSRGRPGVGKTELAKVLAGALGQELIRLQCYEGLDEAKALYEWEYAKQLLYTQILKDKISEVIGGARSLREAVDRIAQRGRRLLQRPLHPAAAAAARDHLRAAAASS